MTKMKRALSIALCLCLPLLSLSAFAERDKPLIGIIQIVDHPALDAARKGFLDALEENGLKDGEQITVDYRNAQGSQDVLSSIADHFVASNADLVLAIATPSAQTMAGKTRKIPILGTAITDYVSAQLVDSNEAPGGNVSGTSDMNPIQEQIELMVKMVPGLKTIGLLYTASEANSVLQISKAKEIIEGLGLQHVEVTVHNTNDVQQATASILDRCEAIYIPTDNVFASAMPVVQLVTVPRKMPVFCGDANMVLVGGAATKGLDYYRLGYQTGLMALKVLKEGADVSGMPIEWLKDAQYVVNKTICDAIGLEIPEDLMPYAVSTGE